MRIGIIELHYHAESLSTLIDILSNHTLDVFTTKKVYNDMESEAKSNANFIFVDGKKKKKIIKGLETEQYELFFVNTIQESMLNAKSWLDFCPYCTSILTLHNINAWLNKDFIFNKNILHALDSYLFSLNSGKILKKFQYLAVNYKPMVDEVKTRFSKDILFIPWTIAKDDIKIKEKGTIDFVIPGTVDKRRRAYEDIIQAFREICDMNKKVRIVFLGELKDFKYIKDYEGFITFEHFVSRDQYENFCKEADFIVVPCTKTTNTVNVTEELYGITKSPNLHSAIKYRKPLIVPSYIKIDESMETSTIRYTSENLVSKIEDLLHNEQSFNKIKEKAIENMEVYTKYNIKKELEKTLKI